MISLPSLKIHNKGVIALISANIIWGAAAPIFKLSLENIPPFTLAFLRFFGASLLLYPFAMTRGKMKLHDLPIFILVSLLGITINISFFFLGLKVAPSINAPVIASSGPIFIYIASVLFLKERPHKKMLAGLLISLLGIILIVGGPIFTHGIDTQILGNLFFLISTIAHVGYTILSIKILKKYRTFFVIYWTFLIGALSFLPFFLYETVTINPLFSLDYRGFIGIVFGIFLSSALAYFLYDWGIKRIPSQEIGIFSYVDPLAATIIAIPLLHEAISSIFLLGSVLIFAGIAVAESRFHYHPFHKI